MANSVILTFGAAHSQLSFKLTYDKREVARKVFNDFDNIKRANEAEPKSATPIITVQDETGHSACIDVREIAFVLYEEMPGIVKFGSPGSMSPARQ
jgi:hypothetical protein